MGEATLLLPLLRIQGRSAARFDLPTLSLHFFGAVVPIDEFYLILLGSLVLVSLTLLVTVVFGRLWCGWLCPQTVIGEFGEWIASALPPGFRSGGMTLVLFPFSAMVSLSLLWYFVPPVEEPARLLDDPEVAVPPRGRVTGTVTVQGWDGTPGEILITAVGRGFRIVRKAAFP